jgi:hypothetical protein
VRTKLSDTFVRALSNDFETHGNDIIEQLRLKHPERYAELVGQLIAGEQNAPDEKQKAAPTTTEGIARQALREIGMADEDFDEAGIRLGVDAYCQFLTKLEQIKQLVFEQYSISRLSISIRPQFKLSLANIEVTHKSGYTQTIALKWIRTGFGGNCRPRPVFICKCGHPVRKFYLYGGSLLCFHCCNAVNASQICGKRCRPMLQQKRLEAFLSMKKGMWKSTKQRLSKRIVTSARSKPFNSERIAAKALLPQSNYNTRGTALDLG